MITLVYGLLTMVFAGIMFVCIYAAGAFSAKSIDSEENHQKHLIVIVFGLAFFVFYSFFLILTVRPYI